MKNPFFKIILVILIILIAFSPKLLAKEITVGTIRDLTSPLGDIKKAFEKKYPQHNISFIYAREAEIIKLLRQPDSAIDMIILDNNKIITKTAQEGHLDKKSIKKLATDKLCVVVKKSKAMRPFMLYPKTLVMEAIASSNPNFTASGMYTKEALISLGIWEKISKKIVYFEGNQQVAAIVARGQDDGGIMYCSFAKDSFVAITDILNPKLYSPIIYTSAIRTKKSKDPLVCEFNNFLLSTTAKNVLKKYHLSL